MTGNHRLAYDAVQASNGLPIDDMAARDDMDLLFKALADPSRRTLLDVLHAHDGQTLNELCEHLDMTRQGVTQQPRLKALSDLKKRLEKTHG